LKKLGVNVSAGQSPLSSLISSIGAGTKTVNNSVVNVNLNMLKDVNIDDMIDDDDDEERKFLIKELEKKSSAKRGSAAMSSNGGYASDSGSSTTTGAITGATALATATSLTPGGIKR
jgi:hypothetical protein